MKKSLLILCGGRSAEHEVSLLSAKNILASLHGLDDYDLHVAGIDRQGQWWYLHQGDLLKDLKNLDALSSQVPRCFIEPHGSGCLLRIAPSVTQEIHVVFPIIHGPYGEDGCLQGLLEMVGVPYVGCGVGTSAVGMDKDYFRAIMAQNDIPMTPCMMVLQGDPRPSFQDVQKHLKTPRIYVKSASLGSSIGISRVGDEKTYLSALDDAFSYGSKVLLEAEVMGREIECAVLGGPSHYACTDLAEIKPKDGFYSYDRKYFDPHGAEFSLDVVMDDPQRKAVQQMAIKVAKSTQCWGLVRVDFFVTPDRIFVNEMNTIPGFTSISMYPKLWEKQGVGVAELCRKLMDLAFQAHESKRLHRLLPYGKDQDKTQEDSGKSPHHAVA